MHKIVFMSDTDKQTLWSLWDLTCQEFKRGSSNLLDRTSLRSHSKFTEKKFQMIMMVFLF